MIVNSDIKAIEDLIVDKQAHLAGLESEHLRISTEIDELRYTLEDLKSMTDVDPVPVTGNFKDLLIPELTKYNAEPGEKVGYTFAFNGDHLHSVQVWSVRESFYDNMNYEDVVVEARTGTIDLEGTPLLRKTEVSAIDVPMGSEGDISDYSMSDWTKDLRATKGQGPSREPIDRIVLSYVYIFEGKVYKVVFTPASREYIESRSHQLEIYYHGFKEVKNFTKVVIDNPNK